LKAIIPEGQVCNVSCQTYFVRPAVVKAKLALENAIAAVIKEGKVRTYDMGGRNTTLKVAEVVAGKL
jgi:isocitrate/isopropylmalate dehydrogenase